MKTLHSDINTGIVSRLRSVRCAKRITQQGLADELGVPQSYVSKVESQERRLDVGEFVLWCEALDVNPSEVIAHVRGEL